MSHWSARKGQTEPFAALAAVAVVALALAVYAGAFEAALPGPVDRNVAQPAADDVERNLTVGGVVRPTRLDGVTAVGPDGYETNVTLASDGERWTDGPRAPETADTAVRRVSVFRGEGSAVPGRLEVTVWT